MHFGDGNGWGGGSGRSGRFLLCCGCWGGRSYCLTRGVDDDDGFTDSDGVAFAIVDLDDRTSYGGGNRSGRLGRSDLEEVCVLLDVVPYLHVEDGDRTLGYALAHLGHFDIECRHEI